MEIEEAYVWHNNSFIQLNTNNTTWRDKYLHDYYCPSFSDIELSPMSVDDGVILNDDTEIVIAINYPTHETQYCIKKNGEYLTPEGNRRYVMGDTVVVTEHEVFNRTKLMIPIVRGLDEQSRVRIINFLYQNGVQYVNLEFKSEIELIYFLKYSHFTLTEATLLSNAINLGDVDEIINLIQNTIKLNNLTPSPMAIHNLFNVY